MGDIVLFFILTSFFGFIILSYNKGKEIYDENNKELSLSEKQDLLRGKPARTYNTGTTWINIQDFPLREIRRQYHISYIYSIQKPNSKFSVLTPVGYLDFYASEEIVNHCKQYSQKLRETCLSKYDVDIHKEIFK